MPDSISSATAEYRETQDTLKAFLDECCIVAADRVTSTQLVYSAYQDWARASGESVWTLKTFTARMEARGFKRDQHGTARRMHWFGVAPTLSGPPF